MPLRPAKKGILAFAIVAAGGRQGPHAVIF